jgi:hypothetical protein
MSKGKVLLCQRKSKRGVEYLSGYLNSAGVVGFLDNSAPSGEPVWSIYVSGERGRRPTGEAPVDDDIGIEAPARKPLETPASFRPVWEAPVDDGDEQ